MDILHASKKVRENISNYVVENINPESFSGACAISAYTLNNVLKRLGYQSEFAIGYFYKKNFSTSHAFVIVENQIVDISATQFGKSYPEVYITDIDDKQYRVVFVGSKAYKDLGKWVEKQNPFNHKRKLIKIAEKTVKELQCLI